MEETKRRRFIIRAVLEGEVDVQEPEPPQPTWDFEWYCSEGVIPSGMTYKSYNFTDEPGILYVREPNLDFDHIGDAEIEVECKFYSNLEAPNNPAISLKHAAKDGAKIWPADGVFRTNISGSSVATVISYEDYHVINLKRENGIYTLKIDDAVISTGTGVTNNNYLGHVGINSSGGASSIYGMYIKNIKWRTL